MLYFKNLRCDTKIGKFFKYILSKIQNDSCIICKNKFSITKNIHIDHDHKTDVIRGILCNHCNLMIGISKEDIKLLNKFSEYLNIDTCLNKKYNELNMNEYYKYRVKLWDKQNGKCKICNEGYELKKMCLDHDHNTNNVRGLLCNKCNLILGHSYDKIEIINNCIIYLNKNGIQDKILEVEDIIESRRKQIIEDGRKKMSESSKNRCITLEFREKLRKSNLGKKLSSETKKKISVNSIGKMPWNKGISSSEYTKDKIRESKKGRIYIFNNKIKKIKYIKTEYLDNFLNLGWQIGRKNI